MNANLLRRLKKLEERVLTVPPLILVMAPPYFDPATLQPGERIVVDWYERRGPMVTAGERITTDPNDNGRRCSPTGDVWRPRT